MKILLTGAGGMVGKNVLEHESAKLHDFLTPKKAELNLLNYREVDDYVAHYKPNLVIHAAGRVGGIQANMAHPVSFLVENLDIGKNIIMASKNNNVNNFINLGSSCMYPRDAKNPLSEDLILKSELEPTNEGYALAKIICARLCEYISNEDKSKHYKTIIPCNLYGRYDKYDAEYSHMIPAAIKKIYEAKIKNIDQIDIWGDGYTRREFMYAGDLADFIFKSILNFDKLPQYINVGLGYDYTINEYYQAIANVIGYKGRFAHDLTKPVGMRQKLIDDTRLKHFGWHHTTSLEKGLKKTFEYYKNQIEND